MAYTPVITRKYTDIERTLVKYSSTLYLTRYGCVRLPPLNCCILTNTHFHTIHSNLLSVLLHAGVFHGCRKLYWSDHGTDSGVPAKIASANMDGTSLKTLFTGNLEHLEFLTLDIEEQKLYWAVTSRGVV